MHLESRTCYLKDKGVLTPDDSIDSAFLVDILAHCKHLTVSSLLLPQLDREIKWQLAEMISE